MDAALRDRSLVNVLRNKKRRSIRTLGAPIAFNSLHKYQSRVSCDDVEFLFDLMVFLV